MNPSPGAKAAVPARPQSEVGRIFNDMADEYDDLRDLWYPHLFARIHWLLLRSVQRFEQRTGRQLATAADIGCGTGFQSILLARAGFRVSALDIASHLVELARAKNSSPVLNGVDSSLDLYTCPYPALTRGNEELRRLAEAIRAGRRIAAPTYIVADANALPYADDSFDLFVCCGSTLSFIEDYSAALDEMTRVTRPGGLLFLEVEQRWNLDLFWPLVDHFVLGHLRYGQSLRETIRSIFWHPRRSMKTTYPFETHTGNVDMAIWLFTISDLRQKLENRGIHVDEYHAIHVLTNIIPSTLLHSPRPGRLLRSIFLPLARLEAHLGSWPLLNRFGCSLVIVGQKR